MSEDRSSTVIDEPEVQATPSLQLLDLIAADRCDRGECRAQAYVQIVFIRTDHTLAFCGHHFNLLESSIATYQGVEIRDFRHRLKS